MSVLCITCVHACIHAPLYTLVHTHARTHAHDRTHTHVMKNDGAWKEKESTNNSISDREPRGSVYSKLKYPSEYSKKQTNELNLNAHFL